MTATAPQQRKADILALAAQTCALALQSQRLKSANAARGSAIATSLAGANFAALYDARDIPEAQSALDALPLTYEPDAPPPDHAYASRLLTMANLVAIQKLTAEAEAGRDRNYKAALAERARDLYLQTPAIAGEAPPDNWSKRQQRAFDAEARAAESQLANAAYRAQSCYRRQLPVHFSPAATAPTTPAGRANIAAKLDDHPEDHIHILATEPDTEHPDGERAVAAIIGLVYQEHKRFILVNEPFPTGYPAPKASAILETAERHLVSVAAEYQDPANIALCRQAAAAAEANACRISPRADIHILGKITHVAADGVITVVSVTQARADRILADNARDLLEREVDLTVLMDEYGGLTAAAIQPLQPEPTD